MVLHPTIRSLSLLRPTHFWHRIVSITLLHTPAPPWRTHNRHFQRASTMHDVPATTTKQQVANNDYLQNARMGHKHCFSKPSSHCQMDLLQLICRICHLTTTCHGLKMTGLIVLRLITFSLKTTSVFVGILMTCVCISLQSTYYGVLR